ncbi:helix-turn-helix transcriptional regulator [Mycolicibacterium confluentis]|nr:helix-turn-helix transcriptional regulator [Mycolicibacterium confluentis]
MISALADAPHAPAKIVVTGGVGTGKTTTLAAVREVLRGAGIDVGTAVGTGTRAGDHATVVDDADLLSDAELAALTQLASDPEATLVIACQPREQRAALRDLITVLERERPRVTLGPLSRVEVGRRHDSQDTNGLTAIMAATAGLPFLVGAVHAGDSAASAARTTQHALVDRLRRCDEPLLDAMLITSLGSGLGPADIAAALHIDLPQSRDLVDRAHATGLLDPALGSRFRAAVHAAVAQVLGAARHHEIETSLLTTQLELSTLSLELSLQLAEHGVRDPGLAATLESAARHNTTPLDQAVRIHRAAVAAGAESLTAALADALARAGQCTEAAVTADALLGSPDPDVRANAVRVSAAVAAHDGNVEQAAELFTWLGADARVSAAAALTFLATGDAQAARESLRAPFTGPPTSGVRAARNLAEGLLLTVDHPYSEAMARLGQALGGPPATEATVDTPAAVVALTALHAGDPVRARSVLARVVRDAVAHPDPLFDHRHRLLQAWVKMQDGQLALAAAEAAQIDEAGLHRRDGLWLTSLRTAIARRNGDSGALQQHWYAAMEVLAEHSIDLFSLLPLGELWVAAARMRQQDRLAHPLERAFDLLHRLGDPPAWSLPLHWAGVHAAILANSPEAMAPHGQALTTAAPGSAFARALATAGRAWLRVLANQVTVDEVTVAARGLAQFGLTWDATRLAGQAALQASDPRVSSTMLQVARDLKMSAGMDVTDDPVPNAAPGAERPVPAAPSSGALSEREREVAELLLLGMPYRDIGAQLFISAKTVEHHVARIRRRLGAESRSEMLSMLRAILSPA